MGKGAPPRHELPLSVAPHKPAATAGRPHRAGAAGHGACNGPGAAEAGQVAESFDKLAQDSPDQACNLISDYQRTTFEKEEKQPCAKALADADLPEPSSVESVDVYGHDARVVLGKDVVFLARFPEGWRVTAAGCKPRAKDDPYDCVLSGG